MGKIEEELFWLRDDASLYRKIEPAYTIPKISDKKSITAKDQMIVEKIRRIIAADYGIRN